MTGYGTGSEGNFSVEVRSSNQRNLDIRISVPPYLYRHEPDIRKMVKGKFQRGRVEIFTSKTEENSIKLRVNRSLAKEYYNALNSIKKELSIYDDIGINTLARQRDIFSIEEPECDISQFFKALEAALDDLNKMREEEGATLSDDILRRIDALYGFLTGIEAGRAEFMENARNTLSEKLKNLLDNSRIDETRIIQETAILVERSDITEEIVRIKSHLGYMKDVLAGGDAIGKKMDFLTQELIRETNTIGAKSADASISALIVDMKYEIEKIREQLQNIQ
jgi:uncharacterized protein (TIGR00255 family)